MLVAAKGHTPDSLLPERYLGGECHMLPGALQYCPWSASTLRVGLV